MAKGKYDKYILSGMRSWNRRASGPIVAYWDDQVNRKAYKGSHQYYIHWVGLKPEGLEGVDTWEQMGHGPHEHTYPEVVMHLGTDPFNPLDLGAEVEFCLGPEKEKHILTTSDHPRPLDNQESHPPIHYRHGGTGPPTHREITQRDGLGQRKGKPAVHRSGVRE
jgi:hypothetical protein